MKISSIAVGAFLMFVVSIPIFPFEEDLGGGMMCLSFGLLPYSFSFCDLNNIDIPAYKKLMFLVMMGILGSLIIGFSIPILMSYLITLNEEEIVLTASGSIGSLIIFIILIRAGTFFFSYKLIQPK